MRKLVPLAAKRLQNPRHCKTFTTPYTSQHNKTQGPHCEAMLLHAVHFITVLQHSPSIQFLNTDLSEKRTMLLPSYQQSSERGSAQFFLFHQVIKIGFACISQSGTVMMQLYLVEHVFLQCRRKESTSYKGLDEKEGMKLCKKEHI